MNSQAVLRERISRRLILSAMQGYTDGTYCGSIGRGAAIVCLGGLNVDTSVMNSGEPFSPKKGESVLSWLQREIPSAKKSGALVSVGIRASSIESFVSAAKAVEEAGADIFEIDAHCNNRYLHSIHCGHYLVRHPDELAEIVSAIKAACGLYVSVKCATHVMKDPASFAKQMEQAGADILHLDVRVISFPFYYIHRPNLNLIKEVRASSSIAIIATGTVRTATKALRFFEAGADAVGIAQATLKDSNIIAKLQSEIKKRDTK